MMTHVLAIDLNTFYMVLPLTLTEWSYLLNHSILSILNMRLRRAPGSAVNCSVFIIIINKKYSFGMPWQGNTGTDCHIGLRFL